MNSATTRASAPGARQPDGVSRARRRESYRNWMLQAGLFLLMAVFAIILVSTTLQNLENRNINTGFGFLDDAAGFNIGEASIDFVPTDSYARAIAVGLLNTLKVSAIAIAAATCLGILLALARLSPSWLVARLSAAYVEIVRNVPLLVQLVFWYALITQGLPVFDVALELAPGIYLSNRGLFLPTVVDTLTAALLLGAFGIGWYATSRVQARRGTRRTSTAWRRRFVVALTLALAVAGWRHTAFGLDVPVPGRFNFVGGLELSAELLALVVGLSVYTSAYLAEIIRGGILAVPDGQREAAASLGLGKHQVMARVILPQAVRTILPPATSWFLNTVKNSSLAIAIGYPDLVAIADTAVNQTGQAIEGVAIVMSAYLCVSLGISALTNAYNRRVLRQGSPQSGGRPLPKQAARIAPGSRRTGWQWARSALFPTPASSLASIALIGLLSVAAAGFFDWALWSSAVRGGAEACRATDGACWAFIAEKYRFLLYGTYPVEQQWRPMSTIVVFAVALAASFFNQCWGRNLWLIWAATVVLMLLLMSGGPLTGLDAVPTALWGGLPVTLILATVAVAVAFPVGILLALGRRSTLPLLRAVCVSYIEFIRGVPLISVLFMAAIMFPLFLPEWLRVDSFLRVQAGLTLFAAAYMAEVVRGGLQSVPKGQLDAAASLGLGYWGAMRHVVLPQALKVSIPAMANTFISEIKNTTLVVIVGLFDLLHAVRAALLDVPWRPYFLEAYLFVGFVFFCLCFPIARLSQRMEMHDGASRVSREGRTQ